MFLSTFHGGAVLVVDWRDGVDDHSKGIGSNKPFKENNPFTIDDGRNVAKVTRVIDFVGGAADNPDRRDTLRANTLDEQGNLYSTNRRRSQPCLRGQIGAGGCNPGVFRQRVSIDIVADDDGRTDEDATLALDPGVNVIAGIRINRISARGCDLVQAEAVAGGADPASREVIELCNVETLYVAASAMNPGCVNFGPVGANPCFTPGGYVAEYRIDEAHLDGASASCSGDPADGFGPGEGNEGCAQPIVTCGGVANGDVNIDPRIMKHPPFQLPEGTVSTGSDFMITKKLERDEAFAYDTYALNEDYEMVEGDWTFQIWFEDKMLVEQTFTTYWPDKEDSG